MNDGTESVSQILHATLISASSFFARSTTLLPLQAAVPLDAVWQLQFL